MKTLRTPEDRFENLPDYPFKSNYIDVDGMRMHYVDEGPEDGQIILMLHGEPSWSYLYRHMIPLCANEGHRVIAPDLIGFGKSDKPTKINDYSYEKHINWLQSFIDQLNLNKVTLVCQDWGALLGLRLAAENESRFDAIVVGNGMLLTGDEPPMPTMFKMWKLFARITPWFPIGRIVSGGCFRALTNQERAAYDAPFPNEKYKAGTRAFPRLVPTRPDDPATEANRSAWKILRQWEKPFLTAFSNGDPITRGLEKVFMARIPGSKTQKHETLKGGHFLQEDSAQEFSRVINDLLRKMNHDSLSKLA